MSRYVIGGAIVAVFLAWGAYAFLKTTVRYVSLDEARAATRMVQTLGAIDFSTVRRDVADSRLEFEVYDGEAEDPTRAVRLAVVYYGVVPGNFDQATSVVLKGKSDGGFFVAEQMLVKCPSKYQGEAGEGYQDMRRHEDANRDTGA